MNYRVSQVFWLGFLIKQDWKLYSALCRPLKMLPSLGRTIEQSAAAMALLVGDPNQAELSADLPGHWLGCLCGYCWTE